MHLAQVILGEPSLVAIAVTCSGAAGFILKKLFDIEGRIIAIEERCQLHRNHER